MADLDQRRQQRQSERWQANQALLARVHELLAELWGEGATVDKRWVSVRGGPLGSRLEVNVSYGTWTCDELTGGSLVELVWKITGATTEREALEWCTRWLTKQGVVTKQAIKYTSIIAPDDKQLDWSEIDRNPGSFWARAGMPSKHAYQARWEYRDAIGRLLFYVCRFTKTDFSGKLYRKLAYFGPTEGWRLETKNYSIPTPWPLYGLEDLLHRPDAPVLVVEGEKACDAARKLLPQYVVIAWPGGGQAAPHVDWSPLSGRKVTLWPDNDKPGLDAMQRVMAILTRSLTADVAVVETAKLPVGLGWDLADDIPAGVDPFTVIRQAHDLPEWLVELNRHYFISIEGGKACIFQEGINPLNGLIDLTRMNAHDFCLMQDNKRVLGVDARGNPVYVGRGSYWLEHPKRREYAGTVFMPGNDVPVGFFNLWRGFSVERRRGIPRRTLAFIFNVICNRRKAEFKYVMSWLARMVQYPQHPGETAIVLRGQKGVGKGFFANLVGSLMRQHFLPVSSFEQMTGRFNGFMRQCVFLFVDEAFWAGDKKHRSMLQSMITEKVLTYEHKGRDPVADYNRIHMMIASNDEWVVPASVDERRYCVLNVSSERRQDRNYFTALERALEAGEREQLLNLLLGLDLSQWSPLRVPQNRELSEQKMESLSPEMAFIVERLNGGEWRRDESFNSMYQSYLAYCDRLKIRSPKNNIHLGRSITKMFEGTSYGTGNRNYGGKVQRWVNWPSDAETRLMFETKFGLQMMEDIGELEQPAPVEELPY